VLITGGTGALGLLVASWLVNQQGVGQLLLLGRAGKPAEAAPGSPAALQLLSLLSGNASVTIMAADASAAADSAAAAAVVREQLGGALLGVVHAAGVLQDAALRNQSLKGLKRYARLTPCYHHDCLSSCPPHFLALFLQLTSWSA
jgi:NAD(P)-dependent dehydrogenase (short-subunit alcohol dehydrogenase family)